MCGLERQTHRRLADGPHFRAATGWLVWGKQEVQKARRPHKSAASAAMACAQLASNRSPYCCWQKREISHPVSVDAGRAVRRGNWGGSGDGRKKRGESSEGSASQGDACIQNHPGSDEELAVRTCSFGWWTVWQSSTRFPKVTADTRARWTRDSGVRQPTWSLSWERNFVRQCLAHRLKNPESLAFLFPAIY